MAAAGGGLKDVKHFANTRPEKFGLRQTAQYLQGLLHNGQWINSGIGDPPGEDRNDGWDTRI
jgi:hypothetical protein